MSERMPLGHCNDLDCRDDRGFCRCCCVKCEDAERPWRLPAVDWAAWRKAGWADDMQPDMSLVSGTLYFETPKARLGVRSMTREQLRAAGWRVE